jgi:hypothetical protein
MARENRVIFLLIPKLPSALDAGEREVTVKFRAAGGGAPGTHCTH